MKENNGQVCKMLRLPGGSFYKKNKWFLCFVGGLFFGIFYGIFFAGSYLENVGFVSDYFQVRYLQEELDTSQFFPYLLKGRGLSFFLIWLMGSSFLGSILVYLVLGWIGFSVGIYLVAAVVKYKAAGIGFCLAALFPQGLFYIPAFGLVLWQAYWMSRRKTKTAAFERNVFFERNGNREKIMRYLAVLIVGMILLFLGVLTESYVNPKIFKKLLEKF